MFKLYKNGLHLLLAQISYQEGVQYMQEDKENFCNSVRAEVKAAGMLDSPANCWSFFIDKVGLCQLNQQQFIPSFPEYTTNEQVAPINSSKP